MKQIIKIKRLRDDAQLPKKATPGSAGYDLFACLDEPVALRPGERLRIPTGLVMELPSMYGAFLYARSGLASKHGIDLANAVGVIDSDYRGEVQVALRNTGASAYAVQPGERIAQLLVMPVPSIDFIEADNLGKTERGAGGFGSTGAGTK